MIVNKERKKVEIIGYDQGLDWSVSHKNGLVTIIADKNIKTTIYYLQYKREVLNFIKEVENFYKKAGKGILAEDKIDSSKSIKVIPVKTFLFSFSNTC